MGQICLECLISARWSTVRLQSMMFSATFAREAPEKQHNPAPVPISHCHFPLRRVWERISSHFFTFLHLRGSRNTRNTTRRSGPRDLGTPSGWSQRLGRPRRPRQRRPACLSSWRRAVTKTRCAFGVASLRVSAVSSEA